ncbi:MAG: ATP-binding protein [Bacteroidales bacterium]|nr:ATP-binding protein [Bacteroidales bacterium]MCL2133819.1 ATP-binding protein [Bacteroidales bacterium]
MVKREILHLIKKRFFQKKAIILVGPRQVGKTTLLQQIIEEYDQSDILFLNCDEPEISQVLKNASSTELKNLIGNKKIILIDEAQRIDNVGLRLKLITDNISNIQLIVTGSSAFDLRNRLNESLTGRKFEYRMYPFSIAELISATSCLEEKRLLEQRMIYGMYPDVVNNPSDAQKTLIELNNSYLFKDVLMYKDIRNPDILTKLLIALSLQVGREVSYNELGRTIGVKSETVERYIELLEKVFIVFRQHSLSRNLRNELKKSRKIYFYDNGVRNALIQNFKSLELRMDTGALWENFMISERKKYIEYNEIYSNTYFWRTHTQQEIDYIEERDGILYAFEFKWNEKKKAKVPNSFATAYPQHEFQSINRSNYLEFITKTNAIQ